jgi:malonyl-CoA O-methyltransferase
LPPEGPESWQALLAPGVDSPAAAVECLEAIHRHVAAAFATQIGYFEDHIRSGDGRFGFLLREGRLSPEQRVLDAGCGRGAVARALLTAFPGLEVSAVDLSPEMLSHVPGAARPRRGSIQNLPFEDGSFDLVYCIEALEHAGNPEGAVDELCRVVRPGGRVLIVDKNVARAGALAIESWESWFARTEVECWLRRHCSEVGSELLTHCPELGPGLFIGWHGTRT